MASLAAATVAGAAATAESETRPDLRHFESRSIEISKQTLSTVTNILPPPGERTASDVLARIGLVLLNKSRNPLWLEVRLTPPPPSPPCPRGTAHLEPGESVEFRCTQEFLVADMDYPIDITVFADSALTDTLERNATRLKFDRRTVERLEERLAFHRQEIEDEKRQSEPERPMPIRSAADGHIVITFSGGLVRPMGEFSEGFGTGGMGTTTFGLSRRWFGARILFGSTEPGARAATNAAYSARVGRPVEVMQAIVPIELQGIAAFPTQTARLALALEMGAGLHLVTVRLKNTDDRLDEEKEFGFSAGAGARYGITPPGRTYTIAVELKGVFHGSGSSRYSTVEFESAFFW